MTALDMRDILGTEGALDLIDATVQEGVAPAVARWWVGELARLANQDGVSLGRPPHHSCSGGCHSASHRRTSHYRQDCPYRPR